MTRSAPQFRSRRKGARAAVIDDRPPHSNPSVDLAWLERLADAALDALGVSGRAELVLTLVDVDRITALNVEYLGGTGPTDVLSFPLDEDEVVASDDRGMPRLLGDVVICPKVAAAQAPDHTGDLSDELALLCVHGILHLLGHDHAAPDEARSMRALEADVLARVHGPIHAGTEVPS